MSGESGARGAETMGQTGVFGLNGRFLTQAVTGVQRYARNVTWAMNGLLAARGETVPLLVPEGTADPRLPAMPMRQVGRLHGHAWEQFELARAAPGRLLNLCNSAPILRSEQAVCIHDAHVFVSPEIYGRGFRTFYRTLHPLLARRGGVKLTTVSAFSAQQIAQFLPVRAADIQVLYNGHEHALAWDPARAQAAPAALAAAPDRPFVLVLGSRARHKNMRLMVEIAPELAALGIDVWIAGGQAGIFSETGVHEAPNVKFLGFVSDDDLAFLMDRALCLAFPSLTEGFGLPVVEAMARGCPVVSSDRASLPEICGDAALMAAPDDPARWVAQIRTLRDSPALRTDLVGRGHIQAAKFSWNDTAEGYADLMTGSWSGRRAARSAVSAPSRQEAPDSLPRVAVVVATLGRPKVASETLRRFLDHQTLKPAAVVVSCITPEDAGEIAGRDGVTVVTSRPGLATQRNAALAALPPEIDIVAFFDDDFVADPDWLAVAARLFRDEPDIVGFTGEVVAEGIKGPGFSFEEADRALANAPAKTGRLIERFSPYGCNMAFRRSAIGDLRFDERLVLYGWLEDRDFGAALARRGGRLVKCLEARGVHMGVKGGRIAGDRLGYSQVVNPIYMLRKGTMTTRQATRHLLGNILSNLVRSAKPEPFVDRRGRLRGNLRGLTDVARGRLEPERAAQIRPVSGR